MKIVHGSGGGEQTAIYDNFDAYDKIGKTEVNSRGTSLSRGKGGESRSAREMVGSEADCASPAREGSVRAMPMP